MEQQQTSSPIEQIADEKIIGTERITPVGELLKKSFRVFKQGASKFLGMTFLIPLLGMLPMVIIIMLLMLVSSLSENSIILTILQIILGLSGFISILFLWYILIISTIGMYILLRDFSPDLKVREAFKRARPYLWKFVIVNLLTVIIVILWSMLFVIPGIIVSVYYTFAIWVLIFEDYEGMSALRRSKELVKGYWWSVFGRFLAVGLIYLVITIIFIILLALAGEGSTLELILSLIMQVIDIIISIILAIYSYLIYKDLVKIKGESMVEKKESKSGNKIIIVAVMLIFLVPVVTIALVSLNVARMKARDAHRVANIKTIQLGLEIYHDENNERYPMELSELTDLGDMALFSVSEDKLKDPKSDIEYKYTRKGFDNYELCFEIEEDNRSEYIQGENCVTAEGYNELMNY